MKVADSVITCTIILLVLLCGSAAGNRKFPFSFKAQENGVGMVAMAPSSDEGNHERWLHSQHAKNSRGSVRWDTGNQTTSPVTARALDGCNNVAAIAPGTVFGAYWDWSWDELVAYDLPATIQYVHDQTGQNLHYVGHSQGTLMALAAFSTGEVLNMLRSAALLCPIAYMGQLTSPLAKDAADNFVAETVYWLGLAEFDPRGEAVVKLLKDICSKPGVDCTNLLTSFTGQNCCLNSSIVNIFLDHEPQPSATKNMVHLAQMIRQGTITMYDYGNAAENTQHYGQPTPPAYDMTSIPNDLPLFVSYGGEDALADVNDVKLLLGSLKDHDGDKLVVQYRNDYAHADYVMADNAKQDVYDPLIAFFRLQ
ncbi:hypothetical protein V6N11_060028 [Hibiscus sabdariffa]|uniref:Lipase n=2 Tax=Hibiscus sabdariffa TaxID=183260 RepID=A0ABR2BFH5_9ROSI